MMPPEVTISLLVIACVVIGIMLLAHKASQDSKPPADDEENYHNYDFPGVAESESEIE